MNKRARSHMVGNQGGFALLMLVIVVAIIAVLYFVQLKVLMGPGPILEVSKDERPWLLEKRILEDSNEINMPRRPKPGLGNGLMVRGSVLLEQAERGEIVVDIGGEGKVEGYWSCTYSHEDQGYAIDGSFAGNVDGKVTYEDDKGKDKSLLYFIAKGDFTKEAYNSKTGHHEFSDGLIYVTGWLGTDYSATGKLTITSDKRSSVCFDWSGLSDDIQAFEEPER